MGEGLSTESWEETDSDWEQRERPSRRTRRAPRGVWRHGDRLQRFSTREGRLYQMLPQTTETED